MAPTRHSMTEMHRATNDATGANIAAGYVPIADGSGDVTWAAGSGGASVMWFNVLDYGAVAGTDCTVAIQAADTAAAAVNGTVYFPASDDSYLVSFDSRIYCVKPSSNVTWRGDGMFSSIIELDPASTVPTRAFGGIAIIAIGTPSAGVDQVNIFDLGILPHWSTKGSALRYLCGIYAVEQESNFTEHSDDICIERVRVSDSYIGIGATKAATIADAGYTASRHQRWAIRECYIDTTGNKAIDLQMAQDSEIADNAFYNVTDGIQLLNYCARVRVVHNSVSYINGGINVREGCSDIDVDGNVMIALGGASASLVDLPAGIALGTEGLTAAVASARVVIRNNIITDTLSTLKVGLMFTSYTGNSGATCTDYLITGNVFNATTVHLGDPNFPANSSAVRLRVFDNYFSGAVTTNATWVSDRTRFERNHVTSNFTSNSNNWDFRNNVFGGTVTHVGTGYTLDDGLIRSVLVSATPPSSGQVITASSATVAAWATPSTAPTGAAGGDLSGTYPNPSVVDDSHAHTAATITGVNVFVVDPGTPSYAGTPLTVSLESVFGIDGSGNPYYNAAGVTVGEEAALMRDPDTGTYLLRSYNF